VAEEAASILVGFLNDCVERELGRRVEDGYVFVHRLSQEHFANMASED
jgi:hypothetical protein